VGEKRGGKTTESDVKEVWGKGVVKGRGGPWKSYFEGKWGNKMERAETCWRKNKASGITEVETKKSKKGFRVADGT